MSQKSSKKNTGVVKKEKYNELVKKYNDLLITNKELTLQLEADIENQRQTIENYKGISIALLAARNMIDYYDKLWEEVKEFFIKANKSDIKKNKGIMILKESKTFFYKQKEIKGLTIEERQLLLEIINSNNGIGVIEWKEKSGRQIDEYSLKQKIYRITKRDKVLKSVIKFREKRGIYIPKFNLPINIV